MAAGIHGQWIWVDRDRGVTIAKLSSQPLPSTLGHDQVELACFQSIAATL
jgi:CubicO group peptidase (beta-lactamase class C family)